MLYKSEIIHRLSTIITKRYKIECAIGMEIEFYAIPKNTYKCNFIADLTKELKQYGISVISEEEENQYEIKIPHTTNLCFLCKKVEICNKILANFNNYTIITSPRPFPSKSSSSAQYNISLHTNSTNIFSESLITENKQLIDHIDSILEMLNDALYFLLAQNDEEYTRFGSSIHTPLTISWGINNRTTAIRIPSSHCENRRIEFRIPSPQSPPENVILFLLISILYKTVISPKKHYPPTYGNAHHLELYRNELLHPSLKDASENFSLLNYTTLISNSVKENDYEMKNILSEIRALLFQYRALSKL
ncbi:hypothetical protein [Candidatus Fokinia crypta]|uniref:hypothetical protein n=1 Tax=Candidatus Fokinia crypta TaxID=1920990 RepID=UPI002B262A21|nr:hypothetical protein [Candidatus Fokinia cryptica]